MSAQFHTPRWQDEDRGGLECDVEYWLAGRGLSYHLVERIAMFGVLMQQHFAAVARRVEAGCKHLPSHHPEFAQRQERNRVVWSHVRVLDSL